MCTVISLTAPAHYFGRNLDLDCSYGEEVCILPRRFPLAFREKESLHSHYAMIGMATVAAGTPLFYDAANECGLAMAGLNFPGNAHYGKEQAGRDNICSFECIPWILGNCADLSEARTLLSRINLIDTPYSEALPASPLHWIIADKTGALVVEPMQDGLHIYENPVGVLTNNPPFPYQLFHLNNYRGLRADNGDNTFAPAVMLDEYCQGLGGMGLPGDVSSMSRFVRAVFYKEHSVCGTDAPSAVSQLFHLLTSVEMCRGACRVPAGRHDITVYSSCIDTAAGRYYYTTYDNRQISCVDMHRAALDGDSVSRYPLRLTQQIYYQNGTPEETSV